MDSVILRPSLDRVPEPNSGDAPPPQPNYKRKVIRAYRMHRGLAWSVGLLIALGLGAYGVSRSPYYEVSALVYVQPEKARVVTDPTEGAYDSMRYDSYIQQQLQTIVRSDVLTAALNKANRIAGRETWAYPGEPQHSGVMRLQKSLKVERETGSYQLSVSLSGPDAAMTTLILNSVVETYIGKERLDELAQNDQQLQLLREERSRVSEELSRNQLEQAQLSKDLGVADLGGGTGKELPTNQFDTQLGQLRMELSQARAARTTAEAQLTSITGAPTKDSERMVAAAAEQTIDKDPALGALKETITRRRSELATQMAGLTPKNPLFKQDQEEVKRLNESFDEMSGELRTRAADQVMDKLRLQAALARDVEGRVESELQQQVMIATGATTKLQRASALSANILRLQTRFTELDNAVNALELQHGSSGLVHLLVPAERPSRPKVSRKWFIFAAALPFGLIGGLLAAFVRQKFDSRIYIAEDVSNVLDFPPLAVLPALGPNEAKLKDEFMLRLIAGINQAHVSGNVRSLVFSAVSKSTDITELVSSVASSMGILGSKTTVLNPDGLEKDARLIDDATYLSNRELQLARMTEFKRATSLAESFKRLEQEDGRADLIFLEALPLLYSAETEFAARMADITVLVVESGVSTQQELASSLALARRLNLKGFATVLLGVEMKNANPEFLEMVKAARERHPEKKAAPERKRVAREAYPLGIKSEAAAIGGKTEHRA